MVYRSNLRVLLPIFFSTFARTFPLLRYYKDTAFSSNRKRFSGLFQFLFQYLKERVSYLIKTMQRYYIFVIYDEESPGFLFIVYFRLWYMLSMVNRIVSVICLFPGVCRRLGILGVDLYAF